MIDETNEQPGYLLVTSIENALQSLSKNLDSIVSHLYGLVTRVNDRSKSMRFIIITDGTAKIQLILDAAKFTPDEWASIKRIKESNLIEITGNVGLTEKGRPSVFVTTAPIISPALPSVQWPTVTLIGHQILLAKVKKIISTYFDDSRFLEVSPKLLSTSWVDTEVDSLRVLFPGFGIPVHIVPTPSIQLLRTIATTGYPNVYTVSKRFTIEHTSEYDGAEGDIIMAKMLNGSLDGSIQMAKEVIRLILSKLTGFLGRENQMVTEIGEQIVETIPVKLVGETGGASLLRTKACEFSDAFFGTREISIFSYYLPFPPSKGDQTYSGELIPQIIVCDGVEEALSDNQKIASLTIHVDRLVRIIHSIRYPDAIPEFRTLIDLGVGKN